MGCLTHHEGRGAAIVVDKVEDAADAVLNGLRGVAVEGFEGADGLEEGVDFAQAR